MRAHRIVYRAAGLWLLLVQLESFAQDCNLNGVPDATDIVLCSGDPACEDCNSNGVPDGCDLSEQLTYAAPTTITPSVTRPVCLVAAQVNGQAGVDLVSGSLDSNLLEIWLGNGSGGFSAGGTLTVGDGPFDLIAAELNGQSGVDLACVNLLASSNSVSVALNNGSGSFSVTSHSLGGSKTGITAADFDGSNGIDLAVVDRDSQVVSILLNNGSGSFSVHATTFSTGDLPFRIAAFDYDDNGSPDLAVANNDDNSVSILQNIFPSSSGFMLGTTLFPPGAGPYGIVASNIDADDGDDLIIANDSSSNVTVLLDSNQTTAFLTNGPFSVGAAPFACVVEDLNADGELDIATANFNANRYTVLLNNGASSFYNPVVSDWSVGTGPRSIVAADFDGNGIPDIATANRDSSTLSVRLGSLAAPFSADCQFNNEPDDCESDCDNPPFAICRNVTRIASPGTCSASVSPEEVDDSSFDPDGGGVQFSLSPSGPYTVGSTAVVLTVEDSCCNTDTCVATITVLDNESPTINCPTNRTRGTNNGCAFIGSLGSATAVDNCTSPESITITNDAPLALPLGTTEVTWTATDSSGNSDTCTQDVTVVDDDSPNLSCPSDTTVTTNLSCSYLGGFGSPSATDNCSLFEDMTVTNDASSVLPLGTNNVTWMVIDEGGNSDSCVQEVTVVDGQPPVITCPSAATVATNSSCAYFGGIGVATAVDNCSASQDIDISNDAPSALPLGDTEVTWTAVDEAGNVDMCTQTVTVVDGAAPNINCPDDMTVGTNSGCFFVGAIGSASATDNCSLVPSISISSDAPVRFTLGTTPVVWTATDEAGNSSMCTQLVTVVDGQEPIAFCPVDANRDVNTGCSYVGDFGEATGSDACSSVVVHNNAPSAFPVGDTTVTWFVTDQAGNVGTCMQLVSISDATPPSISCPPEFTLATNTGCTYVGAIGTPDVSDNCSAGSAIIVENDAPVALPLGTTEVTWTATDEAGNSATCTQDVTVEDATPPDIACPADVTLETNGGCVYTGPIGNGTATDNCSSEGQITIQSDAPSAFALGDTMVIWTATDAAGNLSTCTQKVTVVDLQPPELVCAGDVTVSADSSCFFSDGFGVSTATDNCSASHQIEITNDAPEALPLGLTVVTWTAVDEAGNSSTCEQRVTVEDNEPPEISCPDPRTQGTTIGCLYDGGIGQASAADNCSDENDIVISNDAPEEFSLGITVVTWMATDEAGNSSTCTQEVTIVDDVPPEISCPAALDRAADGACAFGGSPGQATATDNCTPEESITIVSDAPTPLPLGVTVVTWTATDVAGNSASCTQQVIVEDREAPVLECPDGVQFSTNGGCVYAGSLETLPEVADNCSPSAQVTIASNAPAEFPLGVTVVTWTATDEAGNSSTCEQEVLVVDGESPSISCPVGSVVSANDDCSYIGEFGQATVSDNCSAATSVVVSHDAPAVFPAGLTVVTWTAIDEAGNSSTCLQEVTVVDDEVPFLQCPVSFSSEPNVDCRYEGAIGSPLVADNCSLGGEVTLQNDAPAAFPIGTTAVTWTAMDGAGNQASCVQEVVVRDVTRPLLSCPQQLEFAADSGCLYTGEFPPPEVTDDCTSSEEIQLTSDAPKTFTRGQTMVTWTAVDGGGNQNTCSVEVTVEDLTDPEMTCPEDLVVGCDGEAGTIVHFEATAVDDCDTDLRFAYAPASGSLFPPGETIVTCAVRDSSENSVTCTFTVTVVCGGAQIPGDCNQDGAFDISDPVCLLGFLFLGRPSSLPCGDGTAADPSNLELYGWGGEALDLSSAVRGLRFLFFGGVPHPLGGECVSLTGCPSRCAAAAEAQ